MFTADTLMNRNHSKASSRGRFGSPGDSAKPSQCDQYRANNPPMWFLLLCGCCEYFRIARWSIPEGRLVNDVEPLLHRQSTERWAESDFRTLLSLKTWAVSIKCLSPKGTSEEAVSKKKKNPTSRILWLYRGQDVGICTWGKSERRERLRLRRVNNTAAGHGWAAEGFFLRKEPKVKAEPSLRSCHSQYASLISTCLDPMHNVVCKRCRKTHLSKVKLFSLLYFQLLSAHVTSLHIPEDEE